jgi:hypothetical protein
MKVLIILLLPFLIAWKWPTHQDLVENVYYKTGLKELSLEQLKKGSIAPDKDFHDNRLHHYPPSYNKILFWLSQAELMYQQKDFNNASYSFGVASHYLSDSFVTPHYIEKEHSEIHNEFESQPKRPTTKCKQREFNLKQELEAATNNKNLWQPWLLTKNKNIPQSQVEQSQDLIYQLALSTFQASCINKITEIQKVNLIINKKIILVFTTFFLIIFLRNFSNN